MLGTNSQHKIQMLLKVTALKKTPRSCSNTFLDYIIKCIRHIKLCGTWPVEKQLLCLSYANVFPYCHCDLYIVSNNGDDKRDNRNINNNLMLVLSMLFSVAEVFNKIFNPNRRWQTKSNQFIHGWHTGRC